MFDWRDYGNGIFAFDAAYVRPLLAAIHGVVEAGRVALIDTGSRASLPNTLAALDRLGLGPEAVDYVILTHIHLDHAGGAGLMMQNFPQAKLWVHPRGVRHMVEPSKLLAGVTAVYGAEYVERVYGDILPIPAERIIEAGPGTSISLAGRSLHCLDTPGHARHHICIVDARTGGIFTGDALGLSYRELDVAGRPFIFPTTTPSQFDPTAMEASIRCLLALQPPALYLTHYGRLEDAPRRGEESLRRLAAFVDIARQAGAEKRQARIQEGLTAYLLTELREHGCTLPEKTLLECLGVDIELNAQGLAIWRENEASETPGV